MPSYVVRYGAMRLLGVMPPGKPEEHRRGSQVIARTDRGLEVGEVLCEATDDVRARFPNATEGLIVRAMSADDECELARMQSMAPDDWEKVKQQIVQMNLPMRLVDVERIFGGERLVVYYLAENRVDFRELVKTLAAEFQTRIEMRQIGVRDEAKLVADYGDCGKPVCCNTHLAEMPPVSMRMAKLQKATLDPTKISGRCGRLKCCLRYEYDNYKDLHDAMPPIGSEILTAVGRGRVLAQEILACQLLVAMEDNRRVMIAAGEVLTVLKRGQGEAY